MIVDALFGVGSLVVLVAVAAMAVVSWRWLEAGKASLAALGGAARALRHVAAELPEHHPIRRRLESAPIVEVALEEVAGLMAGSEAGSAARGLVQLQDRSIWVERFGQVAVHLGLLGTIAALVASNPGDLDAFRSRLPLALGTTFWGLVGALALTWLGGSVESLLARAGRDVRDGLLASLAPRAAGEVGPRAGGAGDGPDAPGAAAAQDPESSP